MLTQEQLEKAVPADHFGTASARKSGRRDEWPYVPVIVSPCGSTQILRGLAYDAREKAIARAQLHLNRLVADTRQKLNEPRYRALRQQYGFATELS